MLEVPSVIVPALWQPTGKRQPCLPITLEDIPAVIPTVRMMAQYCRDNNGLGLAAPQIGIYKSLCIVLRDRELEVFINPTILRFAGRDLLEHEGCLSLPPVGNTERVLRSEIVEIASGTLDDPFAQERSIHKGMEARVVQHELDHLNPEGEIFFIDRLKPMAKSMVTRKYLKFIREGARR